MKIIKKTLLYIFYAWLFITVIAGLIMIFESKKPDLTPAPAKEIQAQPIKQEPIPPKIDNSKLPIYTVDEVARDYIENSIAADEKYNGKRFIVRDTVLMINTDILGNPFVMVKGLSRYASFQLLFKNSDKDSLAKLKANTMIKAACEGYGKTLGQLMAKNCEIL